MIELKNLLRTLSRFVAVVGLEDALVVVAETVVCLAQDIHAHLRVHGAPSDFVVFSSLQPTLCISLGFASEEKRAELF